MGQATPGFGQTNVGMINPNMLEHTATFTTIRSGIGRKECPLELRIVVEVEVPEMFQLGEGILREVSRNLVVGQVEHDELVPEFANVTTHTPVQTTVGDLNDVETGQIVNLPRQRARQTRVVLEEQTFCRK